MFVELGYKVSDRMPVYPGLPDVIVSQKETIAGGDDWNGTMLSMYVHAGTHADAPAHFVDGAPGIAEIPIEKFIYKRPLLLDIPCTSKQLITTEDIKRAGGHELYDADIIFFNTGYWKFRRADIREYQENYPALSPAAADFIRNELEMIKAVAIDTLSIENLKEGAIDGYKTHRTLLDPQISKQDAVLIYEDYCPEPLIGKKILSAFVSPLRIEGSEAAPVNIVAELE